MFLSEQFFDLADGNVRGSAPWLSGDDLPVGAADQHEGGEALDAVAVEAGLPAVEIADVAPRQAFLLDGAEPRFASAVERYADDLQPRGAVGFVELFDAVHAAYAGAAPRSPEIDEHALVGRVLHRLPQRQRVACGCRRRDVAVGLSHVGAQILFDPGPQVAAEPVAAGRRHIASGLPSPVISPTALRASRRGPCRAAVRRRSGRRSSGSGNSTGCSPRRSRAKPANRKP